MGCEVSLAAHGQLMPPKIAERPTMSQAFAWVAKGTRSPWQRSDSGSCSLTDMWPDVIRSIRRMPECHRTEATRRKAGMKWTLHESLAGLRLVGEQSSVFRPRAACSRVCLILSPTVLLALSSSASYSCLFRSRYSVAKHFRYHRGQIPVPPTRDQ